MARNPELEAILQARYELETCEPGQKTECRARLDALIEATLSKTGRKDLSSRLFMEIIAEPIKSTSWRARKRSGPECHAFIDRLHRARIADGLVFSSGCREL